jgi:hypothetical protein
LCFSPNFEYKTTTPTALFTVHALISNIKLVYVDVEFLGYETSEEQLYHCVRLDSSVRKLKHEDFYS